MTDVPQSPVVSIVMAMRNSARTIEFAVKSIQMQSLADWEIILIDDGSTDGGSSIVEAFGDPRIRLHRESQTLGLAARLNQAVTMSRGEFIARMDADDICFPERLAKQVAKLRSDSALDLIGCHTLVFNDAGGVIGVMHAGLDHETITARPFEGFPLPHPTWFGRARWFRENLYDPTLMKTQDQDLLLRTFTKSRLGALDEVLLGYRQDKPDLAKKLRGRLVFAGSLLRYAERGGGYGAAVVGITKHFAKAILDVGAAVLGISRYTQRRRFQTVPQDVGLRWTDLWRKLKNRGSTKSCAE
ncbi:MAG: glycosyltransferase family 2 protein [Rhizobium sp.]|nr:MAG: glycosyltransferase family 2 protein [Rhizobium sp.]